MYCPVCGTHITIAAAEPGSVLPPLRFEAAEGVPGLLGQMLARTRAAVAGAQCESERLAFARMTEVLQCFGSETAATPDEFANGVMRDVQALCARYQKEDEVTAELAKFFDGTQLYPQ